MSLFCGTKIYSETEIGNNSVVHSGAIIGADGFGFAPTPTEPLKKFRKLVM
jgi:UDP-3-O-[3-hydroxymyristoyl] glucosamine N-acyltransferase